jgi:hypothetical protein
MGDDGKVSDNCLVFDWFHKNWEIKSILRKCQRKVVFSEKLKNYGNPLKGRGCN